MPAIWGAPGGILLALRAGVLGFIALAAVLTAVAPPPASSVCPLPAPCVCVCQSSVGLPASAAAPPPLPAAVAQVVTPVSTNVMATRPAATEGETGPGNDRLEWYGGPAVATDAASLALMVAAVASNQGGALALGLSGFALGAPINHLVHGHSSRALASLGLRLLAVGLATGVALEDLLVNHCDNDVAPCRNPDYAIAIDTVIIAGVMAVDDAVLARAPVAAPRRAGTTLTPGLLVGPSTAFVSLGGRF